MTYALGITGGIGSGKSSVCRMLAELGARVFCADVEARRLMESDQSVREQVTAAFGAASYRADGTLDRPRLAALVFGDAERVRLLNAIVHPHVHAASDRARERAAREGAAVFVHEAALIFESGGDARLDGVAVVDAEPEVRIRRVMERDGTTRERVLARMRHQWSADELRQRADWVIENGGSERTLRRQVEAVWAEVTG